MSEYDLVVDELREHIAAGRLVLLVGAGASAGPPRNLPTWPQLIERMMDVVRPASQSRATLMAELLSRSNLIAASSLFAQHDGVPKPERRRFFLEQFKTDNSACTQLAAELSKLDVRHFLTTNYDDLLSKPLQTRGFQVYGNTVGELSSAISLWNDQDCLIHLHGRSHVYDTLVYTEATYNEILRNEAYIHLLKDAFLQHPVLAVGFGWKDPPFLETLRFIREKMSGAGRYAHYTVLPRSSPADLDALTQSNFKVVTYDDNHGHGFVLDFVRKLRVARKATGAPNTAIASADLEALVSIYSAITDPNRRDTYRLAAATLVVSELKHKSLKRADLVTSVATRLANSFDDAKRLVDDGLEYLAPSGTVTKIGDELHVQIDDQGDTKATEPIVDAVLSRMMSKDRGVSASEKLRATIRRAVTWVMMAQGKAVARAFANEDMPNAYLLHKLVDEAVPQSGCALGVRETLAVAIKEILAEPKPSVSRALFDLATAAYALERVFLNPIASDVGDALRWRLYLDSNVAMRMLDGTGDPALRTLRSRCERLGTPLYMLGPFLDEVVSHTNDVGRLLTRLRISSVKSLEIYMQSIPRPQISPILQLYVRGLADGRWSSYPQFLSRSGLGTHESAAQAFAKLGIHVEAKDAVRRLDSSVRETLWAELRAWRRADQDSVGARRLRRAEATQVVWLAQMRARGHRAWFLSRDGQLRRALKYVFSGRYSGYVITPSAWMMRLRELHWGDVDVQGFSELMWMVPQQSPIAALKKLTMARVLEREPELAGRSPDWLRDEVEVRFERCGSLIEAVAEIDDGDSDIKEIDALTRQLVDPTVEELLDELARARRESTRPPPNTAVPRSSKRRRRLTNR